MLNFGKLKIVEKTFTREGGATREQAYHGIKFRRYESKIGKKAAEAEGRAVETTVKEEFIISNTVFNKFNLEEYALVQTHSGEGERAKEGDQVYLIVVEDQDTVEPKARIMRRSFAKEGAERLEKGKKFNNDFLTADLVAIGVLDAEKFGNQYLSVTDVTAETTELPAVVKGVYLITVDTTVDKESEEAEAQADEAGKF